MPAEPDTKSFLKNMILITTREQAEEFSANHSRFGVPAPYKSLGMLLECGMS